MAQHVSTNKEHRMTQNLSFWHIATETSVMKRAARVAVIVGTVIALINHGDRMLTASMDLSAWFKCLLTFLVPYCVSTYSSVMAVRDRLQTLEDG